MLARVTIGCVALCVLAFGSRGEEPKETKLNPTVVFSGTHSAIQRAKFVLVTDETGWKELWSLHRGKEHDPAFTEGHQKLSIDFDTHYLVGVFTGDNSHLVVTTFERGETVLIRFAAHGFQFRPTPPGEDKRTEHQKGERCGGGGLLLRGLAEAR